MMTARNTPVAESMTQLQQQFEEFRRTRTGRRKLPEALWQSAVEEARQHGVNVVEHALGLDYTALKKRLSGASPHSLGRVVRPILRKMSFAMQIRRVNHEHQSIAKI